MLALYLAMLETPADQQKFLRFYEANERLICAVALRVLKNPSLAEDAAQQTWYHLLRRWDRFSALGYEEARGYAVTAAKNAAIDLLRGESRTLPLGDNWEAPAPSEGESGYQYLISLIRALPEGYRRVLELKCVEEQTNREIARRLGLNESTVATRIMRGRALLRQKLEEEGYVDGEP